MIIVLLDTEVRIPSIGCTAIMNKRMYIIYYVKTVLYCYPLF